MFRLSTAAEQAKASEVREILKLTQTPEIISFAGGLPAPDLFPIEEIKEMMGKVLEENGYAALQYAPTEGDQLLRELILEQRLEAFGMKGTVDNILITSGSQQGLELTAKLFVNPGDVVFVENPTYLTAISPLKSYGAQLVAVDTDEDGILIEDLERKMAQYPQAKFIYLIPDFQNPTGRTMSVERRHRVLALAKAYHIPIVEDAPYRELVLEGEMLPSLKSLDDTGHVIYLGTFSKIFCPGFRIGWIFANQEIVQKYTILKQAVDLQTSTIDQQVVAAYLKNYNLDQHIDKIKALYNERRRCMLEAIKCYFPKGICYTEPRGGLFIWVTLPEGCDAKDILERAISNQVAFVPGQSFYAHGEIKHTLRLNYSNMPKDKIVEGIRRLGEILETLK
ncbi:MAG: PLP-dependent aminotransferase family protein [Cellulosilyticaceae bacterium]